MSHLKILQDCISSSTQILDSLSRGGIVATDVAVPTDSVPALLFDSAEDCHSDEVLRRELLSRPLGALLVDEICAVYQIRSQVYVQRLQTQWDALHTKLVRLAMRPAALDLLRDAYRANLSRSLHSVRTEVLAMIDERIKEYHRDSEAAATASSSDQFSDTDEENARGHGAEAVAILEAAYAYTTNITQAEKRRLAQATGLEPRQVVIWFQNRRNRKVKSRLEAAASTTGNKQPLPFDESARKRKISCNETAGPRRPSNFVTPEKKARLHNRPPSPIDRRLISASSTTSIGSSVDSKTDSLLSGWAASESYGEQRTASYGSTATSYTSTSVCSSFTSSPASESCSPSIRLKAQQAWQVPGYNHGPLTSKCREHEHTLPQGFSNPSSRYTHRQPAPAGTSHIFSEGQQHLSSCESWSSSASSLLFSDDSDVPRLDFDDLGLNLADFGKEVSLPFDCGAPQPAGSAQLWQRGAATSEAPDGPMHCQVPSVVTTANALNYCAAHAFSMQSPRVTRPHHVTEIAETLSDGDFDLFAALASLPTFQGMSPEAIVQFAASGGQDLSVEPEKMKYARSPPTLGSPANSSTPREKEVVTPPSRVAEVNSPEDFAFTFDFAELGLNRAFEEIRQSHRVAEEEAKMYSISEVEDEEGGGVNSGWETGPEEMQCQGSKRSSCGTIVPERDTPSRIASDPWAIPARPVDLHGQRQAGVRFFAS